MSKRNEIIIGIIAAIVIVAAWFGQFYFIDKDIRIENTGKQTIGVAFNKFDGRRYYQAYKYKVDGVEYEGACMRSNDFMEDGEVFNVYYDSLNPKESVISFDEYRIPKVVDSTYTTRILERYFEKGIQYVHFEYVVQGETIERLHKKRFDEEVNLFDKSYLVVYYPDKPRIGYLVIPD